jgi:TolB-like protein/Flp pilus assembly protein TadD
MVEESKHLIKIDLNQFKLHIHLKHKIELTLHFHSPSRKFYLSMIAFVVNEMKKLGRITSIPLEKHSDLLALLNETVGGSAGSSDKENLLPRIYRKWKDALPDLEGAPLFKVLGRKKEYEDGVGKTYRFTEAEKDSWANLFEYSGSQENVRLRFSIDKLGAGLDDIVIIYEDFLNGDAWERFISNLRQKREEKQKTADLVPKESETPVTPLKGWKIPLRGKWRWAVLAAAITLVVVTLAIWRAYFYSPSDRVASVKRMAFPLPDRPSIAVLPFTNMSKDTKQEYFADGITEEIITALSKVPKMFVIARSSTFTYKEKPVKAQRVAEELGVRYVLEGSVRWDGDRIRITAQLIDALTGHHLWSERYDRDLRDIFSIQEEITKKIITALQVELTEGEQILVAEKGTNNLEAYIKYLQALEYGRQTNLENHYRARRIIEEAIALDPNYAMAYGYLARCYFMEVWLGITKSPRESLKTAVEIAKKALSLDPSLAFAHSILCNIYILRREYDKGIEEGQRAVELSPNGADAHAYLGMGLQYSDRPEEAIPILKKAIRLNPIAPSWYLNNLAMAYRNMGKYKEALEWAKKAAQREPKNLFSHAILCTIYGLLGRIEEARAEAEEILKINPKFSVAQIEETSPQKNPAVKKAFIEALRKAGLK